MITNIIKTIKAVLNYSYILSSVVDRLEALEQRVSELEKHHE